VNLQTVGIRRLLAAWLIASSVASLVVSVPSALAQTDGRTPALILLLPDHRHASGLTLLQEQVEQLGGQVIQVFPYSAVIVQVPSTTVSQLSALSGVKIAFSSVVPPSVLASYGAEEQQYMTAWNALIEPGLASQATPHPGSEMPNDALIAPDLPDGELSGAASAAAAMPGYWQTSEFMAGSVAVGIVLVESDGRVDPSTEDWTAAEKQLVFNKIVAATSWWAALEPRANLRFVYDNHWSNPLPTRVEPIKRPYYDEQYWIADAMEALGYRDPSYFTRVRDYNNHLRSMYKTDWAFTIFVVDSSADSDGRFSDGMFAYAYVGGPFMVLSYRNDGYGPDNLDAIAAHEIGHIFLALDQYAAARQECSRKSGYLDVENQNSEYGGCASNVTSIMRGSTLPYVQAAVDSYARGQIGWRDTDNDGILDPLDTDVTVSIIAATQNGNQVSLRGSARIQPFPSPSRASVTINAIRRVQYRVDGGTWIDARAEDGAFDSDSELFNFTTVSLSPGLRRIEVSATDTAGNVVASPPVHTARVLDPIDGGLITELYPPRTSNAAAGPVIIEGVAYQLEQGTVALVEYRLNGSAWQPAQALDGAFDSDQELFNVSVAQPLEIGTHIVQARATDSNGRVQVNVTSYTLDIRRFTVALPVITLAR